MYCFTVCYTRLFTLKSYVKDMFVHHTSNAYGGGEEHTTHQGKM